MVQRGLFVLTLEALLHHRQRPEAAVGLVVPLLHLGLTRQRCRHPRCRRTPIGIHLPLRRHRRTVPQVLGPAKPGPRHPWARRWRLRYAQLRPAPPEGVVHVAPVLPLRRVKLREPVQPVPGVAPGSGSEPVANEGAPDQSATRIPLITIRPPGRDHIALVVQGLFTCSRQLTHGVVAEASLCDG